MGLVLFSFGIEKIVKKVGNGVFTTNHYGSVVRKHVKPINPRSSPQTLVRTDFRTLAKQWKSITQPYILAWNELAASIHVSNRVGQKKTLTGEAMFIKNNQNILQAGGTVITPAPDIALSSVPGLPDMDVTITAGVIAATFTPGAVATNIVIFRSSGIVSKGVTYNSKFKTFTSFASNATSPQTLTTDWVKVFGTAPVAHDIVFFEFRVVDTLSGFSTLYQKSRVEAT